MYSRDNVLESALQYFNGDELAANVWLTKYALKDGAGNLMEQTPADMHARLAEEFARIESKFGGERALTSEQIFQQLDHFRYIVPQGSPMMGIGNNHINVSLSNCVVVESPQDTISSIVDSGKELANLFKRRCVSDDSWVHIQNKGMVQIKNVKIGDYILSYNCEKNTSEFKKVLNKFTSNVNISDRIVIKTSDGTHLKTSKRHPVLVFDIDKNKYRYIDAGTLTPGTILVRPESLAQVTDFSLDESHIAWFIGCHMGDGSCDRVSRAYNKNLSEIRFRCSGDNREVVAQYTKVFNKISGSAANYHISGRKDYRADVWEYSNQNNGNAEIADKYLDGQIGSKTYSGHVPSYIREREMYVPFIAGLLDADGWIKDGSIVISICAKDIVDEVASWLSSYGVRCHVGIYHSKRKNEETMYRLTINKGQEIISAIMMFVQNSDKKIAQINGSDKVHSYKYKMSGKEIDELLLSYKQNYTNKVSGDNITSISSYLKKNRDGLGEAALTAYQHAGLLSVEQVNEIRQRVMVSEIIKDTRTTNYFDIEVEDNNNFYAGNYGMVNIHNCGVGLDISELRPDGTPVSNSAGTTTGAWSFADFYSYICRMIGQNNRRGALMISMDVRHPDIYKFVSMKEDLVKVTGANVSVRITDDFMRAVEKNEEFVLRWPVESDTPKFSETVMAGDLWNSIVTQATNNAEPGILMWDNILRFMPAESYSDVGFKTISTNPCSEIPLSAYDSCRLISINLKHFVKNAFEDGAFFDFKEFKNTVSMAQRLSDDLVELELEKLKGIIKISDTQDERDMWKKLLAAAENGRRTGLGTHGLADALACLRLKYDSDAALEAIDQIYETLKIASYSESVELAKERGPFKVWDWEKEKDNEFIRTLPVGLRKSIAAYGRRNIANLTNAPTGSVSLVSQTSSGLEPVFKNSHIRRKKRNHNEEIADSDFIDDVGDRWQEFKVFHHNVGEWLEKFGKDNEVPEYFVESDNIDWLRRVEIQAVIQKHIDHAISSTINLPVGTPSSVVGELYFEGWKRGLKGITVYVDGSRSGVLVSEKKEEKLEYRDGVKRPETLPCHIHQVRVKGEKWTIIVGLMEGKPYEVFGGLSELIEIPKKHIDGIIVKTIKSKNKSRYDLQLDDEEEGWLIKDIAKVFDNIAYQVHTRMVSLALRHGAKPSFLVEQLQKDPDSDITSFSKVLARVLKKYIENGTKVTSDKVCPQCESEALVYQEGCMVCQDCGYGKCG